MRRPDRFRWVYEQPFRQEIVADGRRLWVYDPDLLQVVVRPLRQALGETPALLLAGEARLEARFAVTALPPEDGVEWVRLRPRGGEEAGFQRVDLGFGPRGLAAMRLVDALGQETRLVFSALRVNPPLGEEAFRFTPPEGVDVVGEAGP